MGALSALIVGPCVAAPLAGALLYIGRTGDASSGRRALFRLALGMGVPLIVVGPPPDAAAHAGAWMKASRRPSVCILLATALWFDRAPFPTSVQMRAWAALLIIPAGYTLRALDPLPPAHLPARRASERASVSSCC